MKRVTGIGGIFFKAKNPRQLKAWYADHLGIKPLDDSPWGGDDAAPLLQWRDIDNPERKGYTVHGIFPQDTTYFDPSTAPFMVNFRVDDLDGLLAALREEGVTVEDRVEELPFGRFAWIIDPEGNRIELWEPAEGF